MYLRKIVQQTSPKSKSKVFDLVMATYFLALELYSIAYMLGFILTQSNILWESLQDLPVGFNHHVCTNGTNTKAHNQNT